MPAIHPRVHAGDWALARYGELAERSFAALERTDPVADRLVDWLASESPDFELERAWARRGAGEGSPAAVEALFESVTPTPAWVDWRRIDRARALFERAGPLGGMVLSLRSLLGGYTAPVGNKPLAFSGRLREQAPRRVAETARFVTAVCAPGGMAPGAPGWLISLRVRLMHAQVRRLLLRSGRWDAQRWAAPINQHDMLATMLLFSEVYVEGLRILGLRVSQEEAEDWVGLWRYVAWVMGTEEQLLPRDYAEATRLRELIQSTQGSPDADSRALAAALIGRAPGDPDGQGRGLRLRLSMVRGLARLLLGDEVAEGLGVAPAPLWSRALPVAVRLIDAGEGLRERLPLLEAQLRMAGVSYWDWVLEVSLRDGPARFARPQHLARA